MDFHSNKFFFTTKKEDWGYFNNAPGIFDKRKTYTGRLTNIWAKWICIFSRFKIYTEGLENLDLNKQYIFISNHESILDIPIVLSQLPFNIIFLTKNSFL